MIFCHRCFKLHLVVDVQTFHCGVVMFKYSFVVWPSEDWGHARSVVAYFTIVGRVEMEFPDAIQFETFRSEMSHSGLSLREVEVEVV